MIVLPEPNTVCYPYRGLSVQHVTFPLTESAVLDYLQGREVYRRTDYIALYRGDEVALAAVRKRHPEPLFSPVTECRLLAGPHEALAVRSAATDTGNATALARAARAHARPGIRAYIVTGRYEHTNFIWEPSPIRIRVIDVVPPEESKLQSMAEQVVAFDELLPPVELVLDRIDLRELASGHPAGSYLLPCTVAGVELGAPVAFLDSRPPWRDDWTLIGCDRCAELYRHFYGSDPRQVDFCPRRRVTVTGTVGPTLSKCCLLERGIEVDGDVAVVPWGASVDEIREALRRLVRVEEGSAITAGHA